MNGQRKGLEHCFYIRKLAIHLMIRDAAMYGCSLPVDTTFYLKRAFAHHCERIRNGKEEEKLNID